MKKICLSFLFFLTTCAYSGTKGFDILLLNIGDHNFYEASIYIEYSKNLDNNNQDDCWSKNRLADGASGIKHITKKKLPQGIDADLALSIWNGRLDAVSRARKIMRIDDGLTYNGEGYHGMYIIKPEGDKLSIMGVGANSDPKKGLSGISEKITNITIDQNNPAKAARVFEQSLCKVSKPFNIGFNI